MLNSLRAIRVGHAIIEPMLHAQLLFFASGKHKKERNREKKTPLEERNLPTIYTHCILRNFRCHFYLTIKLIA